MTYRSKNFFKLGVILLFNTVWNLKAISFYKRPKNSFKWWLEISIFWNIGQLCTQFSGLNRGDIKNIPCNDSKMWSFNSLKSQSVFELLLWFRRYKHFKLWPILHILAIFWFKWATWCSQIFKLLTKVVIWYILNCIKVWSYDPFNNTFN